MKNKTKYILITFLVLVIIVGVFFYFFLPGILSQQADKNLFKNIQISESAMLQNSIFTTNKDNNYSIKQDEKFNLYYTKFKGSDNQTYDILYIYEKYTTQINPICLQDSKPTCRFIGYFDIVKNELGGVIKTDLKDSTKDINFKINPNFPSESEKLMQEKLSLF